MARQKPLKVLFVASECTPFAMTGGLGDVVAGLSKALRLLGHEARVMIPLYSFIERRRLRLKFVSSHCVHMGGGTEHWFGLYEARLDKVVPIWFVEFENYFGRMGIYDGPQGHYADNAYRFAMLSKAALQVCKDRQWIPDVMHLHDWPSSLAAVFLKTWDRILSPLSDTVSVLTIHNIGYQGVYPADLLPYLGLGGEHFTPNALEDHGRTNLLKAGINYSDALTTVSATHATEILTPSGGMGLAPFLNNRRADFFGILNGVDYEHWNPETDRHLPANFSAKNPAGKAACKAELQKRMNLEVRPEVPVFGVVSRFAPQKGFNLLRTALPDAMSQMIMQIAVLGSGDLDTEDYFNSLPQTFPGRAAAHIGYDVELSHLIEAGSDFFLMPSLYEPCGLNQIYSLRYGTLPIVRAIGGLEDTVVNYNEKTGTGTGFKFLQATPQALRDTIGWAVSTWFDRPRHITQLRQQAMAQDFSWPKSAAQYVRVYEHALDKKRSATV
jgi:starch synthase